MLRIKIGEIKLQQFKLLKLSNSYLYTAQHFYQFIPEGQIGSHFWPFLSYIHFSFWNGVVQIKMGGAFMNSFEYQDRINALLKKLEKDMPEAERLMILDEIRHMLSAFFVN